MRIEVRKLERTSADVSFVMNGKEAAGYRTAVDNDCRELQQYIISLPPTEKNL